jgi:hypothetical protein
VDTVGNILTVTEGEIPSDGILFPPETNAMTVAPNPTAFTWDGTTINRKPDTLVQAQAAQNAILSTACNTSITSGFISSALGSPYTYPSTLVDQHNLSGSVIASLIPNLSSNWTTPFWVMDSAGTWSFASHTAAQIQQAGLDGKAWVTTQQEKLMLLKAQVATATTTSAVQAVVW